jgi:DHA1 family multidrug resistance protein-like MFS transporter
MSFFLNFFVRTPVQLITVRALTGIFLGGMLPTTNALINSIISPEKRGSVFGVTQSFTLMGNVLGPITGGFISTFIGYRGIFIITGIMMAFAAIWIKTVVKTPAKYTS